MCRTCWIATVCWVIDTLVGLAPSVSAARSSDHHLVAPHPVSTGLATGLTARDQVVDVGQALARGHAQQVTLAVDRTGKQRTKDIDRALGTCSQAAAQPRQANLMATDQPINPGMQAAEGFARYLPKPPKRAR